MPGGICPPGPPGKGGMEAMGGLMSCCMWGGHCGTGGEPECGAI